MKRPIIGLSMDSSVAPHYSVYPWYALRKNYCDSIADAGGIPLPLPHLPLLTDDYLDHLDGLVITGGRFDHDPKLYGESAVHPKTLLNPERTTFEFHLLKKALKKNLPVLGICGGHQLLNIVYGGTLVQYIPEAFPNALNHLQETRRHEPTHTIKITPGTLLDKCTNSGEAAVNTSHQQAISKLGNGLIASAHTADGIIEGIEDPSRPFCVGVQWHPEFLVTDLDRKLYKLFIQSCRK